MSAGNIPAGWTITAGTGAAGDYIDIVPPEGERHDARIYRDALHPGPVIYRLASALLDAPQPQTEPVAWWLPSKAPDYYPAAFHSGATPPEPLNRADALARGWVPLARFQPQAEPVAWPTMPPNKGQSPVLFEDGYAEGWAKCLEACKAAIARAESQPKRKPLTDAEIVGEFCRMPHMTQFVEVFKAGVRFAERAHGITGDDHA